MSNFANASDPIAPPSSPPLFLASRKRRLDDDIPVFSSDPIDPSIDSETAPKRIYRGPWWNHSNHQLPSYARNFDSGIYLPSDDSLPDSQSQDSFSLTQSTPNTSFSSKLQQQLSPPTQANKIVEEALEENQEVIDLSGIELDHISSTLFDRLLTLVKPPRFLDADGSSSPLDEDFHSLKPALQVFLANNMLTSLPPSIWNLESITVLSLRNNNLSLLPAALSRLRNLVELNVSNNKLAFLPYELLQLLGPEKSLKKLQVCPNPLVRPLPHPQFQKLCSDAGKAFRVPNELIDYLRLVNDVLPARYVDMEAPAKHESWWQQRLLDALFLLVSKHDGEDKLKKHGLKLLWKNASSYFLQPLYIASSEVRYFRGDGTPTDQYQQVPSPDTIIYGKEPSDRTKHIANPPSLLEMAVKACSAYNDISAIEEIVKDAPPPVRNAVSHIRSARDEAGRICSVCQRQYIIPQTQWIEYWHAVPSNPELINEDELFWPFIRHGCSHACDILTGEK